MGDHADPFDLPEPDALALAADLGVALPAFAEAHSPQLFRGWADRLALAASNRDCGRLTPADLDECDRHLGLRPSRAAPPPLVCRRAAAVDAGELGSPDDLLQAIEDAVRSGIVVDLSEAFGRERADRES